MTANNHHSEHACSHHKSDALTCSCCSPIWKYFIGTQTPESDCPSYQPPAQCEPQPEDRIFHAIKDEEGFGYIQTLAGGENVQVEAIGIKDGLIKATGRYEEVRAAMPDTTTVQFIKGGHTIIPGLFEPHLHIATSAVFNTMTDVGPFIGQYLREGYTRDWVVEQLQNCGENDKAALSSDALKKKWILGRNVDPSLLSGDKAFNAATLDEASKDQPIFLMNSSMHMAYINQAAIDRVTEALDSKNPEYVKLVQNCNGILQEIPELFPTMGVLVQDCPLSEKRIYNEVQNIFTEASRRGVTYVLEAGMPPADVGAEGYSLVKNQPESLKYIAENNCSVRIGAALAATSLTEFTSQIEGRYTLDSGNALFNIPFIKVLSDGSNQGLTGFQFSPYQCNDDYKPYDQVGQPQNTSEGEASKEASQYVQDQTNVGIFNYGYPNEYDMLIKKVVNHGWPMMIHANGDHAINRTVTSLERAGVTHATKEQRRDRIEHASLLSDETLARMKALGTSPSFLIGHVGYWGWVFQQTILGTEKANLLDRCQSAITDYGMRISLHSDYSVTPIGPLRMMEQSITRIMEGAPVLDAVPPQVLNKAEQITRFQALKAATYDAAWHCHADKWAGSLEVGKCADFVILKESPLTYNNPKNALDPAVGMRDIEVLETWKGGVKRHDHCWDKS